MLRLKPAHALSRKDHAPTFGVFFSFPFLYVGLCACLGLLAALPLHGELGTWVGPCHLVTSLGDSGRALVLPDK